MTTVDAYRATLRNTLVQEPGLRLAVLFGSAARGDFRPDSDLDVGIVPMDPGFPLDVELDLQARLAGATGRDVDLVRLDLASTLVKWQVLKSFIVLHEAAPFEASRFSASAAAEYIDFAPALEKAAELFRRRLAEGS